MMSDHGKSDNSVLPRRSSNKAGQRAAERMEGREMAKGKTLKQTTPRTQGRRGMPSALERIREATQRIDGETWRQYGEKLEENLQDLSERLKRGAYRARPVQRVYIPKADGR